VPQLLRRRGRRFITRANGAVRCITDHKKIWQEVSEGELLNRFSVRVLPGGATGIICSTALICKVEGYQPSYTLFMHVISARGGVEQQFLPLLLLDWARSIATEIQKSAAFQLNSPDRTAGTQLH